MPKLKLTKSAIDALPPGPKDAVYWDTAIARISDQSHTGRPQGVCCAVSYAGWAFSPAQVHNRAIWPNHAPPRPRGRPTGFAARLDGRDPTAEKLELRRRQVVDRVDDLVEAFIAEHLSRICSGAAVARKLRSEVVPVWGAIDAGEPRREPKVRSALPPSTAPRAPTV
jgi:hypothetical protein